MSQDSLVNYLEVQAPLAFDDRAYRLAYSGAQAKVYYLQEYLPEGQELASYNNMLMVSALVSDQSAQDLAVTKMGELDIMKQFDPVCNYELNQKPDGSEYLLDFLLSEFNEDSILTLIEFNIYHYRTVQVSRKKKAVVLFAYSERAYGEAIELFFQQFAETRENLLNAMISLEKPEVQVPAN
jgi:hypothetical protein